jgi:hypothetical protein
MVSTLKIEDRLEGATNFRAWKAISWRRMISRSMLMVPSHNDPQELAAHKKKEMKGEQVLLDFVKDHLIPHIFEKKTAKDMLDALVLKLILRHQLRAVEMSILNTVASYLMRITQIRDQLAARQLMT